MHGNSETLKWGGVNMPMLGKPLREINHNELLLLCKKSWREDEQFELKQDVPSKTGLDPWRAAGTISPYARDKILAEVVAFTNSYGGDLVIGIAKTIDKPAADRGSKFTSQSGKYGVSLRSEEGSAGNSNYDFYMVSQPRMHTHRDQTFCDVPAGHDISF
jgi:hypothetical protein